MKNSINEPDPKQLHALTIARNLWGGQIVAWRELDNLILESCAMSLSQDDGVRASLVDDCLFLDEVLRRGGYSTCRFITIDGITEDQWLPYWNVLAEIGCPHERGDARLFAADIPPEVDIYKAYALLDAGEKAVDISCESNTTPREFL